jgi:hypothetical protein
LLLVDALGPGREVAKRKGEKYELIWMERLGFPTLAIEAVGASTVTSRNSATHIRRKPRRHITP